MLGKELLPLLQEMRDIAPPPDAPLWPLAPGWWLLLLLLGLSLLAIGRHWYRRRALRREAFRELSRLQQAYQETGDLTGLSQGASILLRRLALARAPREQVAALYGAAWLGWLDRHGQTHAFSEGPGQALVSAPYRDGSGMDAPALLKLMRDWIEINT